MPANTAAPDAKEGNGEQMKPIPCSERLPKDREDVLYWHTRHRKWYYAIFYKDRPGSKPFFHAYHVGYIHDGTATHWMPMPPPPEEEA